MPVCELCRGKGVHRELSSWRELDVHVRHFHGVTHNGQNVPSAQRQQASGACPECGGTLFFQEGCKTCWSCGYSKCS